MMVSYLGPVRPRDDQKTCHGLIDSNLSICHTGRKARKLMCETRIQYTSKNRSSHIHVSRSASNRMVERLAFDSG